MSKLKVIIRSLVERIYKMKLLIYKQWITCLSILFSAFTLIGKETKGSGKIDTVNFRIEKIELLNYRFRGEEPMVRLLLRYESPKKGVRIPAFSSKFTNEDCIQSSNLLENELEEYFVDCDSKVFTQFDLGAYPFQPQILDLYIDHLIDAKNIVFIYINSKKDPEFNSLTKGWVRGKIEIKNKINPEKRKSYKIFRTNIRIQILPTSPWVIFFRLYTPLLLSAIFALIMLHQSEKSTEFKITIFSLSCSILVVHNLFNDEIFSSTEYITTIDVIVILTFILTITCFFTSLYLKNMADLQNQPVDDDSGIPALEKINYSDIASIYAITIGITYFCLNGFILFNAALVGMGYY